MKYCKKCVQPDTRPGIHFNEDGICGACLYEEEKKHIDWDSRWKELEKIAKWSKKTTKSNYDCAIGVSGGKDSTFQALTARDKLGLRPLLVNSEPEGITDIGRKNIENLKNLGFDVISMRANPQVMKKLIKRDLYEYVNPVKVTEYTLFASTYIITDAFNIPLIIQGENDAFTLGVKNTELAADDDALNADKQVTISDPWRDYLIDDVTEKDLFMYHYDSDRMKKEGVKAVWLQYYTKEWSQPHNAAFSIAHGLTIRPQDFNPNDIGTYSPYFQLDSDLVQVNQMLKYIKFGFGQCTDHACYDIRAGEITREEGIELVRKYDGKCSPRYVKKFCDYVDITVDEFWRIANSVRGDMWEKSSDGEWVLKNPIWEQEKEGSIA